MSEIAQKIQLQLEKLTALQHAEDRLAEVKSSLKSMNAEWKKMDKQLDSELDDIKKLEKVSVKSLFHSVLGSKEEQLEKERQEYLALNLKYKELNKSIEIAEFELDILEKKVLSKSAVEKQLKVLKSSREKEILRTNDALKKDLLTIIRKSDETVRIREEVNQARIAGEIALKSVKQVLAHLAQAKNWGQWDMTNRGKYYDRMKHTSIDRAVDEAYRAKHKLATFRKELSEIGFSESFHLNIESFSKFTDIFFDNLISDWIVQQKIKNVINSVAATHDKIINLLNTLDNDFNKLTKTLELLDKDRQNILIT